MQIIDTAVGSFCASGFYVPRECFLTLQLFIMVNDVIWCYVKSFFWVFEKRSREYEYLKKLLYRLQNYVQKKWHVNNSKS